MALRPPLAVFAVPILALLLTSASGCDPEPSELRSLDLADLSERFACDDVTAIAASADGSEALLIGVEDGLVAAALAADGPIEAVYELPDPRLTVRWVAGSNVYGGHCGRVVQQDAGEWRLDARHDAIAGTLAVRLRAGADGSLVLDADLDELVLADEQQRTVYTLTTELDGLPVQ
jgi:hypothetical protein